MRKTKKCLIIAVLLIGSLFQLAYAAEDFVVKKIQVQGLQRITEGTVYSYLPIKVGDTYTAKISPTLIQSLYDTGFFDDITLSRKNDTLIVSVVERPVIGAIKITGNKDIATKTLMPILKDVGLVEGHVYDPSILEGIRQSLQAEYYSRGKYNARVNLTVTPQPRNRVNIALDISEGRVALIRKINIIGNHIFPEKTLLKQLTLSTPTMFSYFTRSDQYSKEKLDASLENLRSYYMDRGYVKFNVDSAQVAITPDKKSVYLTINLTEGPQYKVKGYAVSGASVLPKEKLDTLITIKAGQVFSRKAVLDINKSIKDALGEKGYLYAKVTPMPEFDEKTKTVFVNFNVQPGNLFYVRQVHFFGNDRTNDVVLRRAMRQMEGGLVSTKNLDQSKWKMQQLSYIQKVDMATDKVEGTDNQVDVSYKVTESPSVNVNASIGYSGLDGILLSAGATQKNFLGTGNALIVNFSRSAGYQDYNISYFNPYYTPDGVSRNVNLYLTKTDPSAVNISGSYTLSQYGADVTYGIPISEAFHGQHSLSLGYGLSRTLVEVSSFPSTQVVDFIDDFGRRFDNLHFNVGWSYSGLNRTIFPTQGFHQSLGGTLYAPLSRESIGYYKVAYTNKYYQPLMAHNVITLGSSLAFGDAFTRGAELPFYTHYFAGGMGSVRGYEGNTLGPKDSNDDPFGGNMSILASLGWIFPNPISHSNVRTTWFFDAGNVFNTYSNRDNGGVDFSQLRYSTGLEVDWLSPMGLINFAFSKALDVRSGDDTRFFDFTIGASF